MRVVGGEARGRRLVAPPGQSTRPTGDRVRESVFNMLASRGGLSGATVADLFAGTGAMGIEALSRGAARAVFVDEDARAVAAVEANLAATRLAGRGTVVRSDVLRWLAGGGSGPYDVVFCDPPYAFDRWAELLGLLARAGAGLVVAESDREPDVPGDWGVLRSRRYGSTVVVLLEPEKGGA